MLSTKLKEAAGNSADATLYVDDVFSTYLYNGLNATQTITTGIDLATKGGLLWLKGRNVGSAYGYGDHELYDSANVGSTSQYLRSDGTDPISAGGSIAATPFTTTGFNLKAGPQVNNRAGDTTVAWTFRKAAKFFDVVTYTGNGSARTIAHSLGVAPGMIIVKKTNAAGQWCVYHRGLTSAGYGIFLNLTDPQTTDPALWNSTAPTSSVFSLGNSTGINNSGDTYVAYLFAHDTSSTGIIQCGSYTTDASAIGTNVNLGWQPQLVLVKSATSTSQWNIMDTMRGFTASEDNYLYPNLANAEVSGGPIAVNATGFKDGGQIAISSTIIYMAIRMPNKPPTTGTQVYNAIARTGTDSSYTVGAGFVVDLNITDPRNKVAETTAPFADRLRGFTLGNVPYLIPSSTAAEATGTGGGIYEATQNGVYLYNTIYNNSSTTYVNWMFKRAPGFFDVVCYTGTNPAQTLSHNLTAVPELIIVKRRLYADNWAVYSATLGNQTRLKLNATDAQYAPPTSVFWNSTTPTATTFTVGTFSEMNGAGNTFVAYLFATLAGISKVGSYTGNGTSQNINCGFAAGARFFLVKATSTTGSWWVWDSARGITAGNDPALQLNSTAAEITTADAVDPYAAGITVNQEATCSINASGVSYIYLAIS